MPGDYFDHIAENGQPPDPALRAWLHSRRDGEPSKPPMKETVDPGTGEVVESIDYERLSPRDWARIIMPR